MSRLSKTPAKILFKECYSEPEKGSARLFKKAKHKSISISFVRIVATMLALTMLFSVLVIAIDAFAGTTAQARVTQGQIDRLRSEKREYERQKREVQSRIESIEYQNLAEMAKKDVLDTRISLTGLEIININEIIDHYYMLIREKEYEVLLAQDREELQLQRYRNRVRSMEENGIISYLEIVFDSTSFSDLLARIDFVFDIMRADARLYDDLQSAKTETIEAKNDLEAAKAELNEEKEYLEQKVIEFNEQLEEVSALIMMLQADFETATLLRDELEAEEVRIQREINQAVEQLRRQQEEERRRQEEAQRRASQQTGSGSSGSGGGGTSSAVPGSGQLMWPSPGRAISEWGAPRDGGRRLHQGLDIGGPYGQHVYAAEAGTVITVSYGSGYGHYVTVSHGNGLQTLYSHLDSTAVTVGTHVSRGQLVGYVGSTGNATTPHLHFEVFVNGVRVNPRLYL